MRIIGARHSQSAGQVLQAIVSFVLNHFTGFFLLKIFRKTATLDHKAINDTMKNSAVIKAFFYILFKVGCGLGRFIKIQFNNDIAVVSV